MEHASGSQPFDREDADTSSLHVESFPTIDDDDHEKKAKAFLKEQGRNLHPALDPEGPYLQPKSAASMQPSFHPSTELHTQQFLEVMEVYQATTKDPGIKGIDLRGKHSWDEVLRVAKDAEFAYLKAGGKPLRKTGRFLTAKAQGAMPYVQLIPNNTFLSVLSGGLKLVLDERRDKVLKTLLRIPQVIEHAESYREIFPSDPALYDRAEVVYLAALAAIEGTTKWLLQKSAWKPVQALVLGPVYSKGFKEKIETLDEALVALQERVKVLADGSRVEADRVSKKVQSIVASTEVSVSTMTEDLKNLTEAHNKTNAKVDHMDDLKLAREAANQAMQLVLEESNKNAQWKKKNDRVIHRLQRQIEALQVTANSLTPAELLEILGVGDHSAVLDVQRVLRASLSTELSTLETAQAIITGERFLEWKNSDASTTLFIEGGPSSGSYRRSGPLSIMSSRLVESLQDEDPAIPIHFFCGMHTSAKDGLRGPQGLIRSLISQVLRLFIVNVDFISTQRQRQLLDSYNVTFLCESFAKLVKRLPVDTVLFCIIDNICSFENKEWIDDCKKVINDLLDLTEDDEVGAVFKLLITSPSRSRFIANSLPPESRIWLSSHNADGRNNPTDRELSKMAARRPARMSEGNDFRSFRGERGARWSDDDESDEPSDFSLENGND